MDLTLDSSIIIAGLRAQEAMHRECKALLQQVKEGRHRAFESMIVPVEVAAAIRRRTGSENLAKETTDNLLKLTSFIPLELTESRMSAAARIAGQVTLKGMDAIIAQIAAEKNSVLVTLDEEFTERAKEVVITKDVTILLAEVETEHEDERSNPERRS